MNVEMKDPLHVYYNKVCASLIMDFAQLCNNGMRIEDSSDSGRIEKNEGRMFAPTKKVFGSSGKAPNAQAHINASNQININFNVLFRINNRIHTQIHLSKLSNLGDILIHWVLLCLKSLITYARDVISNLWIQLLHQIHFQSIGTQTYISISTKGQTITLMFARD